MRTNLRSPVSKNAAVITQERILTSIFLKNLFPVSSLRHNRAVNRAVFLDRDGVLVEERNHLHRVEEVVFIAGTAPALKRLGDAGFLLFVVTNQSGVGRGLFTMADVELVNSHIIREFAEHGVSFQKIYVAPEAPGQPSLGRKPSPQFLFDARDEFGVNLALSFMVGDKPSDLECGWNAGVCKSILVRTGYGVQTEREARFKTQKAVVVDDLSRAVDWILDSCRAGR